MARKPVNNFDNKGYPTPPIPVPDDYVYFCVKIPNEAQHIDNFLGAIQTLTKWYNYKRTPDKRGKQVADWYRDMFLELEYSTTSCEELDNEDTCREYDANENRATFYPEIDATELPLGYVVNPWVRITGANPLVGLRAGDIITDLAHIPPLPTIWDHLDDIGTILALGYPSISITGLNGRGTVRIYLISVFLGGRAIVVKDNDLLNTAFLDTNLDTVSLPPETYAENLIEYTFDTSGEHRIDIVFVPNVSADIEFLGFGGGFRRVEICGFEENGMPTDACCDETNDLLRGIKALLEGGISGSFKFTGLLTPPDVGGGNCAPDFFDHNTDEEDPAVLLQRQKALCITVERYVKAVLYGALIDMSAAGGVIDFVLAQFPQVIVSPLVKLTIVYPNLFSGINAFFNAITNTEDLTQIACNMINGLSGDNPNTFVNFRDSLTSETGSISSLVSAANGIKGNFTLFNEALELANSEDLTTYECPCGVIPEGCELPISIIDPQDEATWTYVGGNVWRVQQSVQRDSDGWYYAMWQDENLQCLDASDADDEITYPNIGAVDSYTIVECGTHANIGGAGGWIPQSNREGVEWRASSPIDGYIKFVCHVEE